MTQIDPTDPHAHVFTITRGAPFLPTLVDALLDGRLVGDLGRDPLALAAVTIYLPTPGVAKELAKRLAARLGEAALLPRMIPLGEADEAELDLAAMPLVANAAVGLDPEMQKLERRLILARLVQSWAQAVDRSLLPIDEEVPFLVPASPADAVALAADLEGLMDALTVESLPWSEIAGAVETEYSRYFGLTLDFVRIAAENWPRILAERGLTDPVSRARDLVLAEAARLTRERPRDPVVIAGSTGSVPATAKLIAAVAGLPHGAVVLPGLDLDLDAAGWDAIETGAGFEREIAHGHPQAVLHRLLGPGCLGVARDAVVDLGGHDPEVTARAALLSQALRPAETTDTWARLDGTARETLGRQGLAGLAVAEAADERDEALMAAVALREALAAPGRTAALITPDRALAMRVAAELARWDIVAEDGAGLALSRSAAGRMARLSAELAVDLHREQGDAIPARIIALLAHPLVGLGLPRGDVVRGAAALEIGVLRGPAPAGSFQGLKDALAVQRAAPHRHQPRAKQRLGDRDWDLAATILDQLEAAFAPLAAFAGSCGAEAAACDLVEAARLHAEVCEALLARPAEVAEPIADASLNCLDTLFDDVRNLVGHRAEADAALLPGSFDDYPAFLTTLAADRTVPCAGPAPHPRLSILDPLGSRLMHYDRVVLAGLDEGVWPGKTTTDSFLNRPMRERIGLNPPERQLGQAAHDFVQALGCRDAVITRAAKREGSPTVPSRFLQRIRAFAGEAAWAATLDAGRRFAGYARVLDTAPAQPRLTQPKPKPDPALFPRSLSVTEIETLVRDPYAVFARHVLGLDPLEAVAERPGAGDRGTMIHAIFGRFAERYPDALPDAAIAWERLNQIAVEAFAGTADTYPELYAEWWPRYERMAAVYLPWEIARRATLARVEPEIFGRWAIPLGPETFTLRARADRIERGADGACIVDFKTGAPPSAREIFAGFSPQLTLEAAMLMHGAFDGFPATNATPDLLYVHASGGRKPFVPLAVKPPKGDPRTVAEIVEEHATRLRGLVARFMTGQAAYTSRPYAKYAKSYGDYDHLARVGEWSLGGDGES
ncbi:double-strand break repair protein AddB [Methylobacterium sp. E-041]|uniref:double-strand break repair protein AddB n=1 Tax=Methylobacterium sp. E-041 TaxID=2836573 RepID=UPI001FBA4F45|nr:double-strand break repair protein AddB [Methylobacterium sp. E-041]MCJ2108712.1 double-strand break repair protein AddB [Methylobacterium sp. E-041]